MDDRSSEVKAGIENGQRWPEFLSSIKNPEEKAFVSSITNYPDFAEYAKGRNIDSLGLWRARQVHLIYGHLTQTARKKPEAAKEGYRLDLGFRQNRWGGHVPNNPEELDKDADKQAKIVVEGWEKKPEDESVVAERAKTEQNILESENQLRSGEVEFEALHRRSIPNLDKIRQKEKELLEIERQHKELLAKKSYLSRDSIRERVRIEAKQAHYDGFVSKNYALAKKWNEQLEKKGETLNPHLAIAIKKYEEVKAQRSNQREKTLPTPAPKKRGRLGLPILRRRSIPSIPSGPSVSVGATPHGAGTTNAVNRVFGSGSGGFGRGLPNPFSRFTRNLGIPNPLSRLTRGFGFPNPLSKLNPISLVEKQILKMLLFSIGGVFSLTFLIAAVALGGGGGLGTGAPIEGVVSPAPSPGEPAPSEQPPPSGDIEQALLNDFNVRLSVGGPGFCLWSSNWRDPYAPGEVISEDAKRKIYSAIATPAQSARFRNLIKEKTITIEFYKGEHIFGCRDGNKITFMNFGRYVNIMGERGPGFFIVHEFGHMIGGRSNLNELFPHDFLKRSPTDADCYNGHGILKSYGLIRDPKGESFAEAIALYIYNKKDGIMDFKNECPATHAWIGGNVFVD